MTLPIKAPPKQLDPAKIEVVWPGDSAVDLEASDLVTWAKEGGKAGLVMRDGMEPDVIVVRAIGSRAVHNCDMVGAQYSLNMYDEAFRHGFVSTTAEIKVSFDRFAGVRGLSDRALDEFARIDMALPLNCAIDAATRARTDAEEPDEERQRELEGMVENVSLTRIVGAHILAHTFRLRRANA